MKKKYVTNYKKMIIIFIAKILIHQVRKFMTYFFKFYDIEFSKNLLQFFYR